ncbi:hypothetical protein BLOT_010132 [Blomia tropicalis]|nr:hypothetical protein BLOT_010132 [Blomia tropicalis]
MSHIDIMDQIIWPQYVIGLTDTVINKSIDSLATKFSIHTLFIGFVHCDIQKLVEKKMVIINNNNNIDDDVIIKEVNTQISNIFDIIYGYYMSSTMHDH